MNNMGVYNPGPKKNIKIIALAVICVVLAAGLVGVLALYLSNNNNTDLKSQILEKDNTISSLKSQIASLQTQISQPQNSTSNQNQIASLNEEVATLNDQLAGYYNIAMMNASGILAQQPFSQDAGATTQVFNDMIDYAGFVTIDITASSNTTFAEVVYSYAGSNFDYSKTVGSSGTAVFPVLPGVLTINIGNSDQTGANSVTASVKYYY